jgi:hypothetical protein
VYVARAVRSSMGSHCMAGDSGARIRAERLPRAAGRFRREAASVAPRLSSRGSRWRRVRWPFSRTGCCDASEGSPCRASIEPRVERGNAEETSRPGSPELVTGPVRRSAVPTTRWTTSSPRTATAPGSRLDTRWTNQTQASSRGASWQR